MGISLIASLILAVPAGIYSAIHQYEKGLIFTDGRGDVADGMLLQAQIFVLSGKDRMDRAATDGLGFYCVWHGNAPSLTRRV